MSWKEIGKAVNDTLRRGKLVPLNRIVEIEAHNTFYNSSIANNSAWADSSNNEYYVVPNGVVEVTDTTFDSVKSSVSQILLPVSVRKIGEEAFYESTLKFIVIPPSVTEIGAGAFAYCTSLKNIKISNGVEVIRESAFENSGLSAVELPMSLSAIWANAFAYNASLKSVRFNSKPTIYSQVFANCTNLKDIYVPWSEGEVDGAPWGATKATIHYNSEVAT